MTNNLATAVVLRHDPDGRTDSTSLGWSAEFRSLLALLGRTVSDRPGEQSVRCWNTAGHARGDRNASMRVNVGQCVWYCHKCGIGGGLADLRRAAGAVHGDDRIGSHARLAPLVRLAAIDGPDLLPLIPPHVLEALRERTGGHRLDRVLCRNLRRLLAAVVDRMLTADHVAEVRFTALDAAERGVSARIWHELLPLLPHLALDVTIGQSGRTWRALHNGRGKGGKLLGTTLTVATDERMKSILEYLSCQREVSTATRDMEYSSSRVEAVTVAAVAVHAPASDGPSLRRRPALATLLADLASHRMIAPAGDGKTLTPPGVAALTVSELVTAHGPSIRRTLRTASTDGLVTIVRAGRAGFVTLTDAGSVLLAREAAAGVTVLLGRIDVARSCWLDVQENAARCRRHRRHAEQDDAPWVVHAPGWVRHSTTGELRRLADLQHGRAA
jgi:hypothetical protein